MRNRWLAAVAIVGILAGCAKHHINDDVVNDNPSTLQIVNHHWSDVDIFLIHDGQRTRVGTVTATGEQNFILSSTMTSAGGSLQLQAHAVGSSGAINSETINSRPGGMQIVWTLENNLTRASLAFY